MRLKILVITILVIVALSVVFFLKVYAISTVTKEKAVEIANKEALRFGYDIKTMDVWISKYDTPWNPYLPRGSKSEYIIERQNKLKSKKYWAINYTPIQGMGIALGGNICVFIDANNGEVITIYRGK